MHCHIGNWILHNSSEFFVIIFLSNENYYSELFNLVSVMKHNPLTNLNHNVSKFFTPGTYSQLSPFCYCLPNQNKLSFHLGRLLDAMGHFLAISATRWMSNTVLLYCNFLVLILVSGSEKHFLLFLCTFGFLCYIFLCLLLLYPGS